MSDAAPFDAQQLEQGLAEQFDDALLGAQLAQNELAGLRGQGGAGPPQGPAVPTLSKDQHQRGAGWGGPGARSSEPLPAYLEHAKEDLQAHFQSAGQQEGGYMDTVCHRSLAEEQGRTVQQGAGPGCGLPPLSMLRGIPQREAGEDYVRGISAAEREWASEEDDAT